MLACLAFGQSNLLPPTTFLPKADGSAAGEARWREKPANGTNYAGFRAADALAGNVVWTLPTADASGCLQSDGAGALSISACGGSGLPVADTTAIVKGSADVTKLLRFEVDGFTTSTTRVLTPQNADYTIAGTNLTNNFSVEQTSTVGWKAALASDFGYVAANKIEIHNINSGTFWYFTMGSTTNMALRDNSGNVFMSFQTATSPFSTVINSHFKPNTHNAVDLGQDGSLRWRKLWVVDLDLSGTVTFPSTITTKNVRPEVDSTYALGSASFKWTGVYADNVYTPSIIHPSGFGAGNIVEIANPFQPNSNNVYALGNSSKRWSKAWVVDIDVSGTATGLVQPTRTISTTSPLGGGGDLSANRTLTCSTCVTTDTSQTVSSTKTISGTIDFEGGSGTLKIQQKADSASVPSGSANELYAYYNTTTSKMRLVYRDGAGTAYELEFP